MKVFFIIKALNNSGGTERVTTLIAGELVKRHYQIGIVSIVGEGEKAFFEIDSRVNCFYIPQKVNQQLFPFKDIFRYRTLRRILKTEQPDVIVIVDAGRSFLKIPASKGFKTITWEHFNVNVNWHLFHPLSRKIAAKYSNLVITLTNQDAENYRKRFGAKNTMCIPNPVTIRVNTKAPLTEKNVLAVGRYSTQKGFDLLLDAWNLVQNKENGWKLTVIGSGEMEAILRKKIENYHLSKSVNLIPITTNIIEEYQKASIYVMSSRHEGLPLVLIEAMAMGLPIVSFDCETGPRDIVVDKITGVLVPPLNINQLAIELDILMNDSAKRKFYAENALKYVEKFELSKIIDTWEEVFLNLKSNQ